ncbi:cell division protein ZapA [Carnimonas nigrificans]|uniref:cell division protein ZapA n=1 Tax=Carnimonas nigrificans TaxID=64323 RepID=UPI000471F635|nr:cell division protein ZapA [Carnimonas nigrificans]
MSDAPQSTVEVTLLGKRYTFRCSKKEASGVERAARYLDQALSGVREHSQTKDDGKVAIMTALNITHELQQQIEEKKKLEKEVAALTQRIENALSQSRSTNDDEHQQ